MKHGAHPSDGPAASKPARRAAGGNSPEAAAVVGSAPAGLSIVATPIGNAADITLRALAVLRGVDLIVCEDTRVSGKLMAMYGIATRRLSYNDHNGDRIRPVILERLQRGERVALISDAGMPLVSDPGFKLVREACRWSPIPASSWCARSSPRRCR
jgi:16S rRNA (cytidine1402-2'-O)-methyltransferase